MSDFAQTVSCDRLPQRMAASTDGSCYLCDQRVERRGELLPDRSKIHGLR